jgi:hypothetical protein
MSQKYDNLYIDILKIGRRTVGTGVSYETLKQKLESKGYDFNNDCIELAVKQWFFDCFHHRGEDNKPLTDINQLEKHLHCNFILKGETCIMLVEHEKSKRNIAIAWLSFTVALLTITYTLIHDWLASIPSE